MRPYKHFVMFAALAALRRRRLPPATSEAQRPRPTPWSWSAAATTRRTTVRTLCVSTRGTAISIPIRIRRTATRYHAYAPDASVRLDVKPKEAEVYVDGYYAGMVDDFDGTFQRLRVEPGEHEIELWLDGYRTVQPEGLSDAGQHLQGQVSDGAARRRRGAGTEAAADRAAAGRGNQPRHAAAHAAADGPRADDAVDAAAAARLSALSRRCRARS